MAVTQTLRDSRWNGDSGEVARVEKRWPEAVREYERALPERPRVSSYVDRFAALQNLGAIDRRAQQRHVTDALLEAGFVWSVRKGHV